MYGIKKYESSVGLDELVYGLVDSNKQETLGELWESHVSCTRCPFENQCTEITEYFENKGEHIMCMDVISILIGEKTVHEIERDFNIK